MNTRDQAILAWVENTRPDIVDHINKILEGSSTNPPQREAQGLHFLLVIGFEAGRRFQAKNQSAPLDNPNIYARVVHEYTNELVEPRTITKA